MDALMLYWKAVWAEYTRDVALAGQTHTPQETAAFHRALARKPAPWPAWGARAKS